jgi:ribosomal protein L7/L12
MRFPVTVSIGANELSTRTLEDIAAEVAKELSFRTDMKNEPEEHKRLYYGLVLRQQNTTAAIRLYKEIEGCDLMVAKTYIESLKKENP